MAIAQTIQIIGLAGLLSYGVGRLAVRSGWFRYHRYALVAVPLASMPSMPRGFTVRTMQSADLDDHVIDAPREVQQQRFAAGLTCLGCFNARRQLVGVMWLAQQHFDEDEVAIRFTFARDCCWDTGMWIAPEHRLSRAFAALWAGTGEWMREHGHEWSLSRIADYNIASLLPHRRMDAVTMGYMTMWRFGGWQWCWTSRPRLVRVALRSGVVSLTAPAI